VTTRSSPSGGGTFNVAAQFPTITPQVSETGQPRTTDLGRESRGPTSSHVALAGKHKKTC